MKLNEKENLFSEFATDYDRMINWKSRLAREEAFFRTLFETAGVFKVLDTACSTGRHAMMFRSWGLTVAASDISPQMVDRARANAMAEELDIDFRTAGLEDTDTVFENDFDAVTCLGNSLPHIKTNKGLQKAFTANYNVLRENGLFILQIRNYRRIYEQNERFMPLNSIRDGDREYLYLRMSDLGEELVTFNIIALTGDNNGLWTYRVESETLKPWMVEDIEVLLGKAGFAVAERYGDYAFNPFNSSESKDLIMVARK